MTFDIEPRLARHVPDQLREAKVVNLAANWRQRKLADEQVFRGMWPMLGLFYNDSTQPGVTTGYA